VSGSVRSLEALKARLCDVRHQPAVTSSLCNQFGVLHSIRQREAQNRLALCLEITVVHWTARHDLDEVARICAERYRELQALGDGVGQRECVVIEGELKPTALIASNTGPRLAT